MARNRISGSVVVILGLIIFIITPYQVESARSGAFPRIISIFLILFGILVALPSGKKAEVNDVRLFDPILLSYFILVLAAIVVVRFFGFYPAILLSLPACLVLFGERNYIKITVFTLIATGIIYLVIDLLLGSRLP